LHASQATRQNREKGGTARFPLFIFAAIPESNAAAWYGEDAEGACGACDDAGDTKNPDWWSAFGYCRLLLEQPIAIGKLPSVQEQKKWKRP
jgi:hypothetical protein